MDNIGDENINFWESQYFVENDDFSWAIDEMSGSGIYHDSSSPDGGPASFAASSNTNKNIVSERNRRKKLNDRLFALRSLVPNISKMDKASIIKDATEYIQEMQHEVSRIQAEITELESGKVNKNVGYEYEQDLPLVLGSKKTKLDMFYATTSPIEVYDLKVTHMGEKTVVVKITCSKRTDTMVKLCEIFESLNLKIITLNIIAFSGMLLKTVFIEADEKEKDGLKMQIETAIAALNDPQSPMISM